MFIILKNFVCVYILYIVINFPKLQLVYLIVMFKHRKGLYEQYFFFRDRSCIHIFRYRIVTNSLQD